MAQDMDEDTFTGKIDWALWRRTVQFARPYRWHVAGLMSIGATCAVWDAMLPRFTGRMIDAITASDAAGLRHVMYEYIAVVAAFVLCIFTFILLAGRIATSLSFDIRQAAFEKLQQLPFSFYDRKAVGWLMARLTGDCSTLSRIMGWALLDLSWGPCVLTALTVMMFRMNWKLALLVGIIVPVLLVVARFFQVRLLLTSRALRKANSQATAAFNEGIVGVRTSKSMVREARNLEDFTKITDTMYGHALQNALYSALFIPLMLSICSVGTALALWRGGVQVSLGGMSLGTLVTFVQYAAFIQFPVQEICNMLTQVQGAQASAERIQGLLDTDVEIRDSAEVLAKLAAGAPQEGAAADGGSARIESIEFRNVTFAYKSGQTVLENFNLKVNAGETVALVGPTGGGKTTIVGLACRFYEPTSGQILLSGVDYRERSLKWLQSSLGMVLQQPHLFSGTVRENIRYGRLAAGNEEIERAAKLVNAHEFIVQLKDGYDTAVGEGGSQLSSGQKQLISLARAVIADPQIFVMDEATSSVDTQTERAIQSAIERVLENRISFVIAHRLSTIRHADRILVINKGKIVEDGAHHELIALRGQYFELYTHQFTHEREEELVEAGIAALKSA
ncbi:MAG TPA: ABC transporter ATP-binding protein [Phycisphaerae bacterium]|nr:ABC transporter ATP-binding protein [Phycisphaerae bacterium]